MILPICPALRVVYGLGDLDETERVMASGAQEIKRIRKLDCERPGNAWQIYGRIVAAYALSRTTGLVVEGLTGSDMSPDRRGHGCGWRFGTAFARYD